MTYPSSIINRRYAWTDKPTAPRTKVIAALSAAGASLVAATTWRPTGAITALLLVASAIFCVLAERTFRKSGFAGDKDNDEDQDSRDPYCI
jgi:hypothetical protein